MCPEARNRLSIARAIAKRPEVFILTTVFGLDIKTDVALRKALKKRTKESTVLIVAQRISTILNAEQIIVLDDGRLQESVHIKSFLETVKFTNRLRHPSCLKKNFKMECKVKTEKRKI